MFERVWHAGHLVILVVLLALLFQHHWFILSTPVPLDLYEGTMPLITGIIADGGNPYTREFQPAAADVYPPFYNIVMVPVTLLFENNLQVHRWVSGVFVVLSCALCAFVTYLSSQSRQHAFGAGVVVYAALLFYGTPVASANALGVFIFLAGLLIPWCMRFSTGSLFLALCLGIAAIYTKQYFTLGIALLCAYLFLFVDRKRAVVLGMGFSIVLLASLVWVHRSSPYFLDNTFFSPRAAVANLQSWPVLFRQLQNFSVIYAGMLSILLLVLAHCLYHFNRSECRQELAAWLVDRRSFFWFCLVGSTAAVVLVMGRNPGNYMTYLFQLMSPFLIVLVFSQLARLPRALLPAAPLVLFSYYQVYTILPKDFSTNLDNWAQIDTLIADNDEILATQMLLMNLIKHDKAIYQDGHTFYFPLAVDKPGRFVKSDPELRVESVWNRYITELYRKIETQGFDLILISAWEMGGIFGRNPPPYEAVSGREYLERYYQIRDRISLSMTERYGAGTYQVQVWVPREHAE